MLRSKYPQTLKCLLWELRYEKEFVVLLYPFNDPTKTLYERMINGEDGHILYPVVTKICNIEL
jgi:hypothetical protein